MGKGADDKCTYKTRNTNSSGNCDIKEKTVEKKKATDLEIIFGKGIQKEREIIDLATELNIFEKSGNWYSYKEKKLGNGKENVVDYLIENPEVCREIEQAVLNNSNSKKD